MSVTRLGPPCCEETSPGVGGCADPLSHDADTGHSSGKVAGEAPCLPSREATPQRAPQGPCLLGSFEHKILFGGQSASCVIIEVLGPRWLWKCNVGGSLGPRPATARSGAAGCHSRCPCGMPPSATGGSTSVSGLLGCSRAGALGQALPPSSCCRPPRSGGIGSQDGAPCRRATRPKCSAVRPCGGRSLLVTASRSGGPVPGPSGAGLAGGHRRGDVQHGPARRGGEVKGAAPAAGPGFAAWLRSFSSPCLSFPAQENVECGQALVTGGVGNPCAKRHNSPRASPQTSPARVAVSGPAPAQTSPRANVVSS